MELDLSAFVGQAPAPNTLLRNSVIVDVGFPIRSMAMHPHFSDQAFVTAGSSIRSISLSGNLPAQEIFQTGDSAATCEVDPRGKLFAAVQTRGLVKVSMNASATQKEVELLSDSCIDDESPFHDTAGLSIASDGRVFIADNDDRMQGRLVCYDPTDRQSSCLLQGLCRVTGIALSVDETFVAVAESYKCRVLRFWIKGDKANSVDVLAAQLPGPPICLARSVSGFWVHCCQSQMADAAATDSVWNGLVSTLSGSSNKKRSRSMALVMQFDVHGACKQVLGDYGGGQKIVVVRSMQEYGEMLFLCINSGVAIYDLSGEVRVHEVLATRQEQERQPGMRQPGVRPEGALHPV